MSDSTDDLTFEMDQSKTILHKFQQYLGNWPVPLLVMTALGLRLYHLEQESLWLDEIGQVLVARSSWWLTILRSAQHYGNTPLDYLVTHLVLYVGQSEGILRLPAVIWGVLSIIVVYLLGRDMFDKSTGYLAAFLMTIIPLHVYYSREVRFYSLATFLTLLSMYTFGRAIERNTRSSWMMYGIAHFLALYSHYYLLIVTAIQGVWLLWAVYTKRRARSTFTAFLFAAGSALVLFLPWLYYDIHYEQVRKQGLLNAPFEFRFPSTIALLGSFFSLKPQAFMSFSRPSGWWAGLMWGMMLVWFLISLRRRHGARSKSHEALLMLLPLSGVLSVLVLDYLSSYFFAPRQLLIYTPILLLVTSVAYLNLFRLAYSKSAKTIKAEIADRLAIILLMLFSLWALWQPLTGVYGEHKQDWRGTARYLMQYLRPDDALVTTSSYIEFYAPELSSQTERVKDVPSLLQMAQLYPRVWILGTDALLRKLSPDVYQWIQKEHPIELSLDPQLRLYVYSVNTHPSQLLEELIRSRAYTPSTLLFTDFLERTIREGYIEDGRNMVAEMLDNNELGIREKADIAVQAGRALANYGERGKAADVLVQAAQILQLSNEEKLRSVEIQDKAGAAVRIGRALSDYGEHDKATDILEQVTSLAPSNSTAWVNLGLVYNRQGRVEDAVFAYRWALEVNPNDYWANHLLAAHLYRKGQWQDVIYLEQRAVRFAYRNDLRAASLTRMAHAYSQLGDITRACEVFRQTYAIQENQVILDEMTTLGCTNDS